MLDNSKIYIIKTSDTPESKPLKVIFEDFKEVEYDEKTGDCILKIKECNMSLEDLIDLVKPY